MDHDARLLVVDDLEQNVDLLVRRLTRFGYANIVTAGNGREALEILASQPMDLVLLDIMMPEVDGYTVLQTLHDQGRLAELPVIMVSAIDEMAEVVRCIELGAEDYLPKPFNPTLLRARVSAALEKKRLRDAVSAQLQRFERDALDARELQRGLLSTEFPHRDSGHRVSVHAVMQPALEVGGDLYDFFFPDPDTLCCMVGDVSGKGVAAGLFMARARSLLRWITAHDAREGEAPDLARVLAKTNTELCEGNSMMMFVTLSIALLDLRTGAVQLCSAGHNPPYLMHGTEAVAEVDVFRDAALGLHDDAVFRVLPLQLQPEDAIFAFSDGITEARDAAGEFFSETRLEAALASLPIRDARAGVEAIVAHVTSFSEGTAQADDITALILHWHGDHA